MKTIRKTAQWGLLPLLVLVAGVVFSSCYEDYGLTTADYDTQLTHYATGANFQLYKYYVMPDTIVHMYDTTKADPMKDFRKFDDQILSLTAGNLEGRGYIRLKTAADTVGKSAATIAVLLTQTSQTYVGYYYDYWYGYWGWYYPGYYPGYYPPSYGTTYEYSTGTIITTILDLGQTLAQHKLTPLWNGLVTGLAGSSSTVPTRLTDGINKLYEQSPYLYAGQ
jgi:hypothetical protein